MTAGPAGKTGGRYCVTSDAVRPAGCHMVRIGGRALRAFRSLTRIKPVVAGITAAAAHRWVVHRVGRKARRSIAMTIAAFNPANWNMGRVL